MKRIAQTLITASIALFLVACASNKPEEVVEAPVEQEQAPVVAEKTGPSEDELRAQELEAKRKKIEEMINKIMAEDVYFEYDKAILTENARELLSQVGDILIAEKQFEVRVEGHTDARGTEAYNLSLGGKRAKAVQDYLLNYGVEKTRLKTVSFGEEKPKTLGETEEAFSKNRRANFSVRIVE